jgi:hypothetical protein
VLGWLCDLDDWIGVTLRLPRDIAKVSSTQTNSAIGGPLLIIDTPLGAFADEEDVDEGVARNPTPGKPSQPRAGAEAGDTPRSQRAGSVREGEGPQPQSQSHAEPSPDRLRQQLETNLQDAQHVMDHTQSYVM